MDERDWTDRPLGEDDVLTLGSLEVRRQKIGPACLVTGDLTAAQTAFDQGAPVGLCGQMTPQAASVRIARDLALFPGGAVKPGWHDSFAVSDADGVYICLSLSGRGAKAALAQGTSVDLDAPSPSAAIQFAGVKALLTRRGDAYLLWVEAPMETYVTSFLRGIDDEAFD
ncbi:MAG: hypothetical protein AAF393_01900 [Pseudomonadota bacterium]